MSTEHDEPVPAPATQGSPRLSVEVVDVGALPAAAPGSGPAVRWSASNQLQTNVVSLAAGTVIGTHVESALDVTLALLRGSLVLRHAAEHQDDEVVAVVQAPAVVVLPAGTRRSMTAGPDGATYLTAHRRRTGMLPGVR